MIIRNILYGYYQEYYDLYMVTESSNKKQQPIPPSHTLCAQQVVKVWDAFPEQLVRNYWKVYGYKKMKYLASVKARVNVCIVVRDKNELAGEIEEVAGDVYYDHFSNYGNGDMVFYLGDFNSGEPYTEDYFDLNQVLIEETCTYKYMQVQ